MVCVLSGEGVKVFPLKLQKRNYFAKNIQLMSVFNKYLHNLINVCLQVTFRVLILQPVCFLIMVRQHMRGIPCCLVAVAVPMSIRKYSAMPYGCVWH